MLCPRTFLADGLEVVSLDDFDRKNFRGSRWDSFNRIFVED
jgi:hypothetical protein